MARKSEKRRRRAATESSDRTPISSWLPEIATGSVSLAGPVSCQNLIHQSLRITESLSNVLRAGTQRNSPSSQPVASDLAARTSVGSGRTHALVCSNQDGRLRVVVLGRHLFPGQQNAQSVDCSWLGCSSLDVGFVLRSYCLFQCSSECRGQRDGDVFRDLHTSENT